MCRNTGKNADRDIDREYGNGAGGYLSQLFRQFQGEPLTTLIGRIPEELGEFHVEERTSRQGLSVVDWRMKWSRDMRVKKGGSGDSDMVQMVFFINRGMDWEMEESKKPVHMRQGELCIYRDRALASGGRYEGGRQLLFLISM